jgi:hypothetical protein
MFTFETTDPGEARRFRIAQFNGRPATFRSAGATVTGHVHSIVESKSGVATAWTIMIVPVEKARGAALRPVPRMRAVAEDYC